jgi:U3 small nucleolar RNA-associated protein 19
LNLGKDKLEVWEGKDPFLMEEVDLKKTNSMESSLWEIETLKNHWNPKVSNFVQEFKDNIRDEKPGFKVDEYIFLDYGKFFEEEINLIDQGGIISFEYQKKKNIFDFGLF